jgi:hypothetical protein
MFPFKKNDCWTKEIKIKLFLPLSQSKLMHVAFADGRLELIYGCFETMQSFMKRLPSSLPQLFCMGAITPAIYTT